MVFYSVLSDFVQYNNVLEADLIQDIGISVIEFQGQF